MLIWGGLRYVVSGGDSKKVTDAKNTVLYAIIGLVISFMAFAIVGFIVDALPSDEPKEEQKEEPIHNEPQEEHIEEYQNRENFMFYIPDMELDIFKFSF